MFFILKLIFSVIILFFLLTLFTGVSFALRIRRHLQNPFSTPDTPPPPPAGKGDIIEGEYRVLDEEK